MSIESFEYLQVETPTRVAQHASIGMATRFQNAPSRLLGGVDSCAQQDCEVERDEHGSVRYDLEVVVELECKRLQLDLGAEKERRELDADA